MAHPLFVPQSTLSRRMATFSSSMMTLRLALADPAKSFNTSRSHLTVFGTSKICQNTLEISLSRALLILVAPNRFLGEKKWKTKKTGFVKNECLHISEGNKTKWERKKSIQICTMFHLIRANQWSIEKRTRRLICLDNSKNESIH